MAIVRLSISIDDTLWPKLKIAGERMTHTGEHIAFTNTKQYDLAYVAFENDLHNLLRPMVEELIRNRQQQPIQTPERPIT